MTATWNDLDHNQRLTVLKDLNDDEIVDQYLPPGMKKEEFYRVLNQNRELWNPRNIGALRTMGEPPTKETLIGSWREIDKSEALLELTDNSIDAWMRRSRKHPKETAQKLKIYIEINERSKLLTYEDNAGGVQEHNLTNLVIPGYSDTADSDRSIGSYKTGGKKAVFKLATEANIKTWYWNPSGTSDEAFEIHLDKDWIEDPIEYKFKYYPLLNRTFDRGQTIYALLLRESNKWDVTDVGKIMDDLRRTYTLLMVRHPEIEIYFNSRTTKLEPSEDLYRFSGANTGGVDIRPQRIIFKCQQPWKGMEYDVDIEIVLGCRTNTAQNRGDDSWGIDVYGNTRLFKHYDQDEIYRLLNLPAGNASKLVRGYINIQGPNVLMPWDTHKRHLNSDRDINDVLRKNTCIKEFVGTWSKVYNAIGGMPNFTDIIKKRLDPWSVKSGKRDINVPHSQTIVLNKKPGQKLPDNIFTPKLPEAKTSSVGRTINISFQITQDEFRRLCTKYQVAEPSETSARKLLAEEIKDAILRPK